MLYFSCFQKREVDGQLYPPASAVAAVNFSTCCSWSSISPCKPGPRNLPLFSSTVNVSLRGPHARTFATSFLPSSPAISFCFSPFLLSAFFFCYCCLSFLQFLYSIFSGLFLNSYVFLIISSYFNLPPSFRPSNHLVGSHPQPSFAGNC